MARGVRNFFEGFNQGYETVGRVIRDNQGRKIAEAEAEDVTQYTPDQAASMESIANTRDAQGNPVYQLTPQEGGTGYGIRVRQDDGSYQPVEGAGMAPTARKRFLGKDYSPEELTPQRMDRERYAALAGVEAKFDPAKGLRMRREVGQMEREEKTQARQDTQWQREDDAFARAEAARQASMDFMKQRTTNEDGTQRAPTPDDFSAMMAFNVRSAYQAGDMDGAVKNLQNYTAYANQQIDLQTKERTAAIGPAAMAANQGDFGPLMQFYNKFVPDGANVTDIRTGPGGEVLVFRQTDDGKPLPTETIRGGVNELLAGLQSLSDPMAMMKFSTMSLQNTLALTADARAERGLKLDEARTAATVNRANRPDRDPQIFVDAKGKPVIVDMNSLPYGSDGSARLPEGLRQAPKVLSPEQRALAVQRLTESGMSREQAEIKVDEWTGNGPAPATDDRSLLELNNQRGAKPAPAAQPPAAPARRIGIIVPPRSAADMQPRAPMSDDEVITDVLGPAMRR